MTSWFEDGRGFRQYTFFFYKNRVYKNVKLRFSQNLRLEFLGMTMLKTIHFYSFNGAMATNKNDLKSLTIMDCQEPSKIRFPIFDLKRRSRGWFRTANLEITTKRYIHPLQSH